MCIYLLYIFYLQLPQSVDIQSIYKRLSYCSLTFQMHFQYSAFVLAYYHHCSFIFFGCAACGKLSSLTGDWTCTSCFGSVDLNHQTAREVPQLLILDIIFVVDDFLPLLHVCLYWWAFPFAIFFFLVVVFFSTERSSFSTCLKLVWFGGTEFS